MKVKKLLLVSLMFAVVLFGSGVVSANYEYDVVVIGGGAAGLVAANTAAEQGASVVLLEKLSFLGGSTLLSGGAIAFAETDMQEEAGVLDSTELFFDEMLKEGQGKNRLELVQILMDKQLATYNWLVDQGVEFIDLGSGGGMSVARCHYVVTGDFISQLADKAEERGVTILTDASGHRLITNPGTKEVVGVEVNHNGEELTLMANRGVILATGGFGRDEELLEKFVPVMASAMGMVGAGTEGDGLRMAWDLGADIADTPYIKATFGVHPEGRTIDDLALTFYHGGIIVNQNAERFVDESINYKALGDVALVQPGAMGFQIYDEAIRKSAETDPLCPLDELDAKGLIYKADTIADLAQQIGVDAQVLEQTIEQYNFDVDVGVDSAFGRTSLSSGAGELRTIENGPFYALPSTAVIVGTYGGVLIDPHASVIDIYGQPIPNLFAAGEVTGGIHGAGYMSGSAITKAVVFGRIAGQNAAMK